MVLICVFGDFVRVNLFREEPKNFTI